MLPAVVCLLSFGEMVLQRRGWDARLFELIRRSRRGREPFHLVAFFFRRFADGG